MCWQKQYQTGVRTVDIAIIGAGNVGRSLATALGRAGHSVVISSRDQEDAASVAASTGARVADSNGSAVATAEVTILAVPAASLEALAAEIAPFASGKVIVDVTNRMAFGPTGPAIDAGPSNAERLAGWLPEARVVKALNTLFASNQADPIQDGIRLDGFVAADDPAAKAIVLEVVDSLGLHPIDAGPLARAQQLEQLAFLNIALNATNGWDWTSGWKLVGAPARLPTAA
jgi:NADPH-dependent F420 reductase